MYMGIDFEILEFKEPVNKSLLGKQWTLMSMKKYNFLSMFLPRVLYTLLLVRTNSFHSVLILNTVIVKKKKLSSSEQIPKCFTL